MMLDGIYHNDKAEDCCDQKTSRYSKMDRFVILLFAAILLSLILFAFCYDNHTNHNFPKLLDYLYHTQLYRMIKANTFLEYIHSCLKNVKDFHTVIFGATLSSISLLFAAVSFINNHFSDNIYGFKFGDIFEIGSRKSFQFVKKELYIKAGLIFVALLLRYSFVALILLLDVLIIFASILIRTDLIATKRKKWSIISKLIKKELMSTEYAECMESLVKLSQYDNKDEEYYALVSYLVRDVKKDMMNKELRKSIFGWIYRNQCIREDKYFILAYNLAVGIITGNDRVKEYKYANLEEIIYEINELKKYDRLRYMNLMLGCLIVPILHQDKDSLQLYAKYFELSLADPVDSPIKYIMISTLLIYFEVFYEKKILIEPICETFCSINEVKNFFYYHEEFGKNEDIKEQILYLCLNLSKFRWIYSEVIIRCYQRIFHDFQPDIYHTTNIESYVGLKF